MLKLFLVFIKLKMKNQLEKFCILEIHNLHWAGAWPHGLCLGDSVLSEKTVMNSMLVCECNHHLYQWQCSFMKACQASGTTSAMPATTHMFVAYLARVMLQNNITQDREGACMLDSNTAYAHDLHYPNQSACCHSHGQNSGFRCKDMAHIRNLCR